MFRHRLPCLTLISALTLSGIACGDDTGSDDASASESGTSGDASAGDGDGDGVMETSDSGADPNCGDGVVDEGEVCDDGNNVTEFPVDGAYAPTDCMSDCSMVLADCGNGEVDPGEECDEGDDPISTDECTTSCSLNTYGVHAACDRSTGNSDTDIASGEITGCDNVELPPGYGLGCTLSTNIFNVSYVYSAQGECQMIALTCIDENCALAPPDIGDVELAGDCPAGHHPVIKTVGLDSGFIPDIASKACQVACESDSDCRWNSADDYENDAWFDNGGTSYGQFRCQVTADSMGEKICVDGRNTTL